MTRVGVILSGCGVFDGSEIHEAVCCLLSLERHGARVQCMAPRREFDVIDHAKQQPTGEKRDVFTESARIARGDILDMAQVNGSDFDAFVLPGGFGAAKNLCTFAIHGADCQVDVETERVLQEAHAAGVPIGFACISPALAARVLGEDGTPTLTIGTDAQTAKGIEAMGAKHQNSPPDQIVVDEAKRIVSTPAYMTATSIGEVYAGIDTMVGRVLAMVGQAAGV